MKTIRHLFTVLMLLCSAVAFAHDFEVGGIYYNITDATNKTVAVTYRGNSYSSYYNEYIGDVVIPESVTYNGTTYSVTSIGNYAFAYSSGLTSVEIPNSVTSIGSYAFAYCSGLTSVEIPNSVTSIGSSAFSHCTGLASVVIGNSVTSIGRSAFNGCSGLTSVVIPSSVTSIGEGAFIYCSGLTSIEIPNSVASIGNYAFNGCSGLTSIKVDGSNTKYDSRENCNAIIETETNTLILGCKNTIIPNSVTSIGVDAFSYCTGLTSIVIPNSVTSIGERTFYGCSGLTSIVIPNSVTSIGERTFYGCSGLTSVEFNAKNCTTMGSFFYPVFENCTALSIVTIGENVKTIPSYAFYACSGLTSIVIPNSVTSIGSSAFSGCSGLTSVTIGNSVTSIGREAFYDCSGLTSIEIPSSVTSIGYEAFYACSGLTSIISLIPAEDLFSIGSDVFSGVKNACTLYVPYGAKETYASTGGWNEFANIVELERSTFNATFYIDGEEIATSEIKAGEAVAYPDVDEREGYTLVWTTDVDVMPSEDIVIQGTFIANTYTVTYTVDGEVYATDSIAYGSEIVLRDEPAKEGYTFSGWSEAPKTMSANDIVIEGSFIVNYYTVTYTVDSEIFATDSIAYGSEIVLRDEPAKEGYTFSGWSEVPETMPANDIVIEGTFVVNTYTVTYTVDGEIYATDSIVYGNEIVLRDEPIKLGYTFSGWSEAPETMPAEDITISGSFIVNSYTVTFTVDGEVYKTMSVEYGAEIPTVEQPAKDGRKFSGWSEIPSIMPAEDVVVEGKFCYTVIFMADGKYYSSSEIYYGGEIETPSRIPHKEGYAFVEWGEFPETMPARDMTIHAIFSVNKYKLIFIIDGEVYETLYVEYGSEMEYPQKDGYIITWETENLPQTMPAENLIIIGTSALDTAVECVKDDNEKIVYTLDGHRILDVENLEKGVYIINGKKVLVK